MSQAHADCPHCRQDGSEAKHIALKEVRIALAGNPNCGKTTAFNEYTGTHQHVGNYPGVTVDKKEATSPSTALRSSWWTFPARIP
mgnify:FL=1